MSTRRSCRVVILTGSHLCHNPRVMKEAAALSEAGMSVEVLGGWFDPTLKTRDRELLTRATFAFRPIHDLTVQNALRLYLRIRGRLANALQRRSGYETAWQLGYFASSLQRAVKRIKADLFVAHSEQALWAVAQAQGPAGTARGPGPTGPCRQWGVDMEDWFSEDLLPEARKQRPIKLLRGLEQTLLRSAAHTSCPSQAMGLALASEYGCRPPTVIYNAFPWTDRQNLDGKYKDRQNPRMQSLHWYSQTLGQGRGLEELFAALPLVKHPFEIHLRGQAPKGAEEWLWPLVPPDWRGRVILHPLVSNSELLSRIAEHDIGFAGERTYCRSRDLTVTNKILHYLLGGLAVVASDTAGQREVAAQAGGAVHLYPYGEPQALARRLDAWLGSAEQLQSAKNAALVAAQKTFCWEKQSTVLVDAVNNALFLGSAASTPAGTPAA